MNRPRSDAHPNTIHRHTGHTGAVESSRRRGTATVELAVCLPVIVLLVFGGIEASQMVFLRQTMTQAAYAGARAAIGREAVTADADQATRDVLALRNIQGAQVMLTPSPIEQQVRGEPLTIRIIVPCDLNSAGPSWFFRGQRLTAEVTMVKE